MHSNIKNQNSSKTHSETVGATEEVLQNEVEDASGSLNENAAELLTLTQKLRESEEKYLRLYADFENFKKRSLKEKEDLRQHVQAQVIEELLPILDDLDRAFDQKNNAELNPKSLLEGIALVHKQLQSGLTRLGVAAIESIGEPFDPNLHEAVAHVESADYPPNSVAAEYRKGYTLKDRLLRPALVAVSK